MADPAGVLVVGATSGLGLEVARHYAAQGREVVISGRDADRAAQVAGQIEGKVTGIALDLSEPEGIAAALAGVGPVDRLVVAGIERDENTVRDYDVARARRLVTLKLVGYTEVVHALLPRMPEDSSVVLFGGRAKDVPYPGSTTVTTINGGIATMINSLAIELAPIRVNAIHPGIVVDSPYWAPKTAAVENAKARTPAGRSVSMRDIVDAVAFLLENRGVTAVNLTVDAGWRLI